MLMRRHRAGWLTQFGRSVVLMAPLLVLTGCVTRKTVLVNDQGKTQTCEASARVGFVSQYILKKRLQHCIDKAESHGFHQAPATSPGTK